MKASLKCESVMSRILAALPREALLKDSTGPPTVTDQTKSAKNSVAAIVSALEHGTQSNLSQLDTVLDTSSGYCRSTFLQHLETYMALCETYGFQKYALPVDFCATLRRALLRCHGSSSSSNLPVSSSSLRTTSASWSEEAHEDNSFGTGVDPRAYEVVKRAGVSCSGLKKSFDGCISLSKGTKHIDNLVSDNMTNIASDMPYQRLTTNDKLMSDKYTSLSSTIEKFGKLNPDAIVPVIVECQEVISAALSNTVDVLAIQSCLKASYSRRQCCCSGSNKNRKDYQAP